MPTQRDWIVLLTIVAVTSLVPSLLVGAGAIGGIVGLIVYRGVRAHLLKRAEQAALDRAARRYTDLRPERFPEERSPRKVISLGERRR